MYEQVDAIMKKTQSNIGKCSEEAEVLAFDF